MPGNCSKVNGIRCSKNMKCILKEQKCDGEIDCPEAEDENDCGEVYNFMWQL